MSDVATQGPTVVGDIGDKGVTGKLGTVANDVIKTIMEMMGQFARPLSAALKLEMLGIPSEHRAISAISIASGPDWGG